MQPKAWAQTGAWRARGTAGLLAQKTRASRSVAGGAEKSVVFSSRLKPPLCPPQPLAAPPAAQLALDHLLRPRRARGRRPLSRLRPSSRVMSPFASLEGAPLAWPPSCATASAATWPCSSAWPVIPWRMPTMPCRKWALSGECARRACSVCGNTSLTLTLRRVAWPCASSPTFARVETSARACTLPARHELASQSAAFSSGCPSSHRAWGRSTPRASSTGTSSPRTSSSSPRPAPALLAQPRLAATRTSHRQVRTRRVRPTSPRPQARRGKPNTRR
mmetsp:Transcript_6720/g.18163  ORF Transcript_6720/g.18163 Transcript_6720/m.18163 type:complete len:276 (+) Transcript_6720:257-1084(+)